MDEDLRARAERRVLDAEQHARRPDGPEAVRRDAAQLRDLYERALDQDDHDALQRIVETSLSQPPSAAR